MKTGVVEQGGDYFWVVKDNQPTLRADIALLFAEPPWGEELAAAEECGRHGDRWEERTLWTSTALNEYLDWPQVRQVCCVERKVTRKGATRKELAYAINQLESGSGWAPRVAVPVAEPLGDREPAALRAGRDHERGRILGKERGGAPEPALGHDRG